jgi:hypothetical protein
MRFPAFDRKVIKQSMPFFQADGQRLITLFFESLMVIDTP